LKISHTPLGARAVLQPTDTSLTYRKTDMELVQSAPVIAPQRIQPKARIGEHGVDNDFWIKAGFLFLVAFTLYFVFRSPGLDEIDSINFALGVRHFNLWEHQPHPAGYPLYIFFGWIGYQLFGVTPAASLHFVSVLGGALFVAAWFGIIRQQFNERLAWWVAVCLVITPVIWMTATKVLSDCPAAALLSAQVLAAICFARNGRRSALLATSFFGAAAAGVRPQLILVVFVVLITALKQRRQVSWKTSLMSWGALIGACLLWLIPMWYIQSRLHPNVPAESVYPTLVYKFWAGRLHKPDMYLFAGDWSPKYLAIRCTFHFLGWFGVGFGFIQSGLALIAGTLLSCAGVGAYVFRAKSTEDFRFWKFHTPWALVHIAGIFVSVTASQRYYVVIFPLLLVALLRGLLRLPVGWNKIAFAFPLVLLLTTVPLAIANHRDDAPPARFVRYLENLYPPEQRSRVVLLLTTRTKRHAEWSRSGFKIINPIPSPDTLTDVTKDAIAVYTDDSTITLPAGWYRLPLNVFTRSVIIYWKAHYLEVYLIDRQHSR
jgi:Dolichyl-phosphate-mannose-protein mannosyltransferase